jgi:hypothetical protein
MSSRAFLVENRLKQGRISSACFSVYMDVLLCKLHEAGVGCFIGSWFAALQVFWLKRTIQSCSLLPSLDATRRFQSVVILPENITKSR